MKNSLLRAFTGTEIEVILLKGELEENGISTMIRDDFTNSISAGFYGGTPSSIDLFINESDLGKAQPILQEFLDAQDPQK
jgi:hypothetical protein